MLSRNGSTRLKVRVTDEDAANGKLAQLVTAGGSATIQELTRDRPDLEDVFLKLVEGGNFHEQ